MKATKIILSGFGGIFIGLGISMLISYLKIPNYLPLDPKSHVGLFFINHHIHPSIMMLYCMFIWFIFGAVLGYSQVIFQKDWSILKSSLSHYLIAITTLIPVSILAGWLPAATLVGTILSIGVEFSLVYFIVWGLLYLSTKRKIETINRQLQDKNNT